jgi:hypothetical protein
MDELIVNLDVALRANHPALYATLRPGIDAWSGPRELKEWFRWRDGQPRGTAEALHGIYRFVGCGDGRVELRHMRSTVWKSPLNAAILAVGARRAFYSVPLLTDCAGDGYYFDLFRRGVYYRCKGERDMILNSFSSFLEVAIALAMRPRMAPDLAAEYEYELLREFS